MSTVSVNDLPGMLADEQRADSIKKGLRGGKVMALEKWESCVNQAISNGDLSICCERRIEVATVNEWLKSKELDLWSLFTLHDPLLPDLEDLFELSSKDLPSPIKNRLDRRFNKKSWDPWDKLSPERRRREVIGEDETNAPHHRLFFALGDLVFWGDGRTLDQVAADDGDSAFVNRLSDLRERLLGNEDIGPEVSTTELAQVLIDGKAKWPNCRVIFPTWLDQLALDTNRQPPAQLLTVLEPANESGRDRDARIANRAKQLKTTGVRAFLKKVADEESKSMTAIKNAIKRHNMRNDLAGGGASRLSLSGQLKAANK